MIVLAVVAVVSAISGDMPAVFMVLAVVEVVVVLVELVILEVVLSFVVVVVLAVIMGLMLTPRNVKLLAMKISFVWSAQQSLMSSFIFNPRIVRQAVALLFKSQFISFTEFFLRGVISTSRTTDPFLISFIVSSIAVLPKLSFIIGSISCHSFFDSSLFISI